MTIDTWLKQMFACDNAKVRFAGLSVAEAIAQATDADLGWAVLARSSCTCKTLPNNRCAIFEVSNFTPEEAYIYVGMALLYDGVR